MPRKSAELITSDIDDAEDIVFETHHGPSGGNTAHQKSFESIFDEMSDYEGEVNLHVHRQVGNGQETMEQIGIYPVDMFPTVDHLLMHVSQKYGGGAYRIKMFQKGRRGSLANKLYQVAEPKEEPVKAGGTDNSVLNAILARMERQEQALLSVVRQSQQGGDKKQWLEEMLMYKQLFGGDQGPSRGFGDVARDVQAIKDIAPMLGLGFSDSGEKEEDGFGALIEKAAPIFQAAMNQPLNPQKPPQQEPPKVNPKEMFLKAKIATGINSLVNAAAKGRDPADKVDDILDNLDESQIRQFVLSPQAFDFVLQYQPNAKPYKQWFDDLAEHVKAVLGEPSKFSDLYSDDDSDINSENLSPESEPLSGEINTTND